MVSRKELEGLITLAIREIRVTEYSLSKRYQSLGEANIAKRRSFLESVKELGRRASQLEELVNQLQDGVQELSAA